MAGALEGVRVVEVGGGLGVAYAGRLLAEGGADVVRVVPPSGDPLAAEPPFFAGTDVSIKATLYNLGKRTLTLDLASDAGRSALAGLLGAADLLLDGWRAADEPLDEAEIAAANAALARVSLTPTGRHGPPLHTSDLVANALSGAAWLTGNDETPPINGYGDQTAHTAGMYAAVCGLAALRAVRLTGTSHHADLSAYEALASSTEQLLMQWWHKGFWQKEARRQGSLHYTATYEVYPDRHGQGIQVCSSLRFMEEVLPWMERDGRAADLADKERYPDILAMVKNMPHVMQVMREWVAVNEAGPMFEEAQRRRVPFGIVLDVAEAVRTPQVEARAYFQSAEVPGAGTASTPGPLFRDGISPRVQPAHEVTLPIAGWERRQPAPTAASRAIRPGRPLEGVRVLDFSHVLAGPYGTRILADLGADVIRVGTALRSAAANNPNHGYYRCWNRNKRSMVVDMKTERGRALCRQLALSCDAIVDNFSAGVLARWGLDRPSLRADHPRVTVVSMSGMGIDGPWRDFVTYAPTLHALVGLTYLTNPPGEHLLGYGYSLTDHLSGIGGALAVLEGIEHARRTGEGLAVDLSQYEIGLHLLGTAYMDHLANGVNPEPVGNRHAYDAWAPHGIYPAAGEDRWVAIAVKGDEAWARLCRVMGKAGLGGDPRFARHAARIENQDALDALVGAWTATQDRYDVMAACQAEGVAAGVVQNAADLTGRDPILIEGGFFGEAEPSGGTPGYSVDRFPARFNGARPDRYVAAHQLGADTMDVLSEVLGLGDAEIADLFASGILT